MTGRPADTVSSTVRSATFSATGQQIITSDSEFTYLWDRQGTFIVALEGTFLAAAPDQDTNRIVTIPCAERDEQDRCTSTTARLWRSDSSLIKELTGHTDFIHSASFSTGGQHLLTASNDEVRLWDETGAHLTSVAGHAAWIESASFTPDGNHVITSGCDQAEEEGSSFCIAGSAKVWDMDGNLVTVLSGHTTQVVSALSGPDGDRFLTVGYQVDGETRLWDSAGKFTVLDWQRGRVTSASFSPDGQYIVTGGCNLLASGGFCVAGGARLWDKNGSFITAFTGHPTEVVSVDHSPEGDLLVTVGWSEKVGGETFLWELFPDLGAMIAAAQQRLRSLVTLDECLEHFDADLCTPAD